MKKWMKWLGLTVILIVLAACTKGGESSNETESIVRDVSPSHIMEQVEQQVEQPASLALEDEQVEDVYDLDPSVLSDYAISIPMMNVHTNEIAILKVDDRERIPEVEEKLKQRAETVQQQFEHYLPDQYEYAKQYQIVQEGPYVLFVISPDAQQIIDIFQDEVKAQ